MSTFRPEFGQHLSDKAYGKALKLYALAKHPDTYTGDANNAINALNNILRSEVQPQQKQTSQAPKNNRRNTAEYWVKSVQSNPDQRQQWQHQSNRLHSIPSATRCPTGPRKMPIKNQPPANDLGAVYLFFFLLILYFIFK